VKMLTLFVFATTLVVASCGQRDTAPSAAAVEVAAQYCSRNFKPWFELARICKLDERNGKAGESCATLGQATKIVSQRFIESDLRECSPARLPEMSAISN
jgi:hypothetical protein